MTTTTTFKSPSPAESGLRVHGSLLSLPWTTIRRTVRDKIAPCLTRNTATITISSMAAPTMKTKPFCAHAPMALSTPAMAAKASWVYATILIEWTAMAVNVIVSKALFPFGLSALVAGQEVEQQDPCQAKSKVVADVTYCDRYWECLTGERELYDCPNGLVWVGKNRGIADGCDYPWRNPTICRGKDLASE